MLKRKQQKQLHSKVATIKAKQAKSITDETKLYRSLLRRLLGMGQKYVYQKRSVARSNTPGLIKIPTEYVDCFAVTVAGKRVPFSRDMQQQYHRSYMPLDIIEEDE